MLKMLGRGNEGGASRADKIKQYRQEIDQWTLSDIRFFLEKKKTQRDVPYNDEALAAILERILNKKRPDGHPELEPKVFMERGRKFIIPERSQTILAIITKITKSQFLSYETNELVLQIMISCTDAKGNPWYKEEIMPHYEKALEKIAIKTEIGARLDYRHGKWRG